VGNQGIARFGREVIKRLPNVETLPSSVRLFNPIDPLWLSWVIRRKAPSVYFSPGFNPPWRSSVPFVFVIHDLNYIDCSENSDFLRKAYFNNIVKPACRRAAKIITVSDFSGDRIVEWAGIPAERVEKVVEGVGSDFTPNGGRFDIGRPYILYVGNRLPHKNLPRLFTALAVARIDCKLYLTGDPDSTVSKLATSRGISDRILFTGNVNDASLANLYRGAAAVVLPSLYEGFGLPIIEAMACGVPVLTSNVTSMPEIAGDAAVLVDPRSVEDIAAGLDSILSDQALRSKLVASGLIQAAKYSWDTTASQIAAILLSESRRRAGETLLL